MSPTSLLRSGGYSADWVRDFYNRTADWWGASTDDERATRHVEIVARLTGPDPKRILDLGSGPGGIAAALADAGHSVVAVEFSDRVRYAHELVTRPRAGSLEAVQADFYTVLLDGRFEVITCWETFGIDSDTDQRRLLRRMAGEWLAPGGCVLMDVYNPARPARHAGEALVLPPLAGVPGSVEMVNRSYYDPVHSRWIDEWQPTTAPQDALAQSLRCYSPADLLLLLEGTGLTVKRLEIDGETLDPFSGRITLSGPLMESWTYLAQLEAIERS